LAFLVLQPKVLGIASFGFGLTLPFEHASFVYNCSNKHSTSSINLGEQTYHSEIISNVNFPFYCKRWNQQRRSFW